MPDMSRFADDEMVTEGALKLPEGSTIESAPEPPLSVKMDPSFPNSPHDRIISDLEDKVRASRRHIEQRSVDWDDIDKAMRLYVDPEEGARLAAKRKSGDMRENPFDRPIRIPLMFSTVMTRVAHIHSVLNGRDPFLHLQPRESGDFRGARLHEVIAAYDMEMSKIALQSWQATLSAEKYGFGIWYDTWEQDYGQIPSTAEELGLSPEMAAILNIPTTDTYGLTREWNNVRAIDPRKFLPDPSFPIVDVQRMGYVGHVDQVSWLYINERRMDRDQGPYINVDLARKQAVELSTRGRYDARSVDGSYSEDGYERKYPLLNLVRIQMKIIPSEWGLSMSNDPEIWWFEVTADAQLTSLRTIVRCHKGPCAHNQFTYSVGESEYDEHAPFQPGMAQMVLGLQYIGDWFLNSNAANMRKMINDQVIYNDDLISRVDMNTPGPAKHIRLTQRGKSLHERGIMPISAMYGQLMITDVTQGHMNFVQMLLPMTQRMASTPDTLQGMPLPSKRTLGEVEAVSQNASMRLGIAAQLLDEQLIRPMAERLVSNRQQFTSVEQYFRIAGRLAQEFGQEPMLIRPEDLAGNYDYIVRTPTMPSDPARQAALYGSVLQILSGAPQLMNPGPDGRAINPQAIFEEFLKASGISHFDQFYIQVAPPPQGALLPGQAAPKQGGAPPGNQVPSGMINDEELARQVEMGNLVALNSVTGGQF
jgi:hypothetical protein